MCTIRIWVSTKELYSNILGRNISDISYNSLYENITKLYSSLGENERKKVYNKILELMDEIRLIDIRDAIAKCEAALKLGDEEKALIFYEEIQELYNTLNRKAKRKNLSFC